MQFNVISRILVQDQLIAMMLWNTQMCAKISLVVCVFLFFFFIEKKMVLYWALNFLLHSIKNKDLSEICTQLICIDNFVKKNNCAV